MRLTADVIVHARASINPCDERELDLRGYKIPMIENLGVTQDQFDAIDFSDNEIKKLGNFPRYKRLSSLLLCNNHVSRIATDLGTQLPNLSCLILTNNKISTLGDLAGLGTCKKLTILSLLSNEVVSKQYYRLYVINLVPSLKQLDFQKVTVKEREAAGRLASSQAGEAMRKDVAKEAEKAKTFTPGAPSSGEQKLSDEHRAIYAARIAKATTVEEVELISRKIQAGIIPSANYKQGGAGVANGGPPAPAPAPAPAAAAPAASPKAASVGDDEGGEKARSSGGATDSVPEQAAPADSAPTVSPEKEGNGGEKADDEELQDAPPIRAAPEGTVPAPQASPEATAATAAAAAAAPVSAPAAAASAPVAPEAPRASSSMDVVEGGGGEVRSAAATSTGSGNGGADAGKAGQDEGDVSSVRNGSGGQGMDVDGEEAGKATIDGDGDTSGREGEGVAMGTEGVAEAEAEGERGQGAGESAPAADGVEDMDQDQEADAGGEPKLSAAEIKKFKVAELKVELTQRGLPTNGLKADLQSRLLQAMGH